tara:strand:+ start:1208 stop:1828 length:621 start_codon:yes stop_codon:yes gene_type:complete
MGASSPGRQSLSYLIASTGPQRFEPLHLGGCPICGRYDRYLNVEREHWAVCRVHWVKWNFGSNLMSGWLYEDGATWKRNVKELAGYRDVTGSERVRLRAETEGEQRAAVQSEFGHTYDHDIATCPECHPIGNYFQDGPCPECGHTGIGGATTYSRARGGQNWKHLWSLCDRCRIAWPDYSGSSVFSYEETGPGDDLEGYRPVERRR